MFCIACLSRATRAARGVRARCTRGGDAGGGGGGAGGSGGAGGGGAGGQRDSSSPLRRLLADAAAFGEARAADSELQWATQPYAAQRERAPHDARGREDPRATTVLLFPGQGAERVGMGRQLQDVPAARDLYDLASNVLGWDVWRVCTAGPADELARRVQPCVLVTSLAALEAARETRPGHVGGARAAAGFSLGELAALVFAGALRLEDALRFAELRAAAMAAAAAARPGGMLTVWLAPDAALPHALLRAREHAAEAGVAAPVCAVANYLYPGCKVVAGDEVALAWLERSGAQFGVRRAARVRVAGAWHCALMAGTEPPLRAALAALHVRAPRLATWSCTEAARYTDAAHVRRGLSRLAARPVRWEQTLHAVFARPRPSPLPRVLALGPGTALRTTLRQVNARAWDNSLQIEV